MLSGFCLLTITSYDQLNRQIMKVEITRNECKNIIYPALMGSIVDGEVILALNLTSSITLRKGTEGRCDVGFHSKNRDLSQFRLFEGKITLENE